MLVVHQHKLTLINSNAVLTLSYPFITGGITSLGSSFYVGAKIITGNDLDQNIEIVYVDNGNYF